MTLGGVPYNISENFGILSITFDVSSERPIKIAGTEVGGVNVDASITIQRLPNTRSAPPPGGPVGSLQMNEDHATNWIPMPSWQQIQTATASNSGAATAYAILAALAGGALYAWRRLCPDIHAGREAAQNGPLSRSQSAVILQRGAKPR